mgnify:CR=1 FL=1
MSCLQQLVGSKEENKKIGVDFKRKLMEVNGKKVRATIWDTGFGWNCVS